eukprot:TRINITY_DN2933_c0_g1_i1.p1 TRINITY_DN2933_c0_g1~~TRINITY_DN2933_c0_g1_i1.p1  ORF type:complete len:727 (+),score=169.16 TRINITY_DN2933_c0_g1_i1:137-2317(+)
MEGRMLASLPPNCPPGNVGDHRYYYTGPNGECMRQQSFFGGKPLLSQGIGYSVVLGFGALFAVLTSFLIHLERKYVGARHSSEWFNTAGRNVKTGLIAAVIVSQWTWAATILQSSNVAFQDGISGPFWYASGATIQVLLFGIVAIEIKRKAPNAHTVCEIIRARWGFHAHLVFLFFCFMTNTIVTAMLLLGGSAVVKALTGANIYLVSFLIPISVMVYTLHGGLKATFLAAYLHSVLVHIVLVLFVFLVYTASSHLGSPSAVYKKLQAVASKHRDCSLAAPGQNCGPVSGNHGGSYVTMLSTNGLVFGIINIVGNFGTVFVDQGYWQSAIAARPASTHKGYLLGGLVWFAVPFSLGTSLGIGAIALDLPLTAAEAGAGLVPPATAASLMGKGGAFLLLTMLFMAVTSAGSSELIAVSSLVTYDIYRTYINPNATGAQILKVSRYCVCGFGLFMGCLAILLNEAGVSLGWMYLVMGVLIGSAVMPIAFVLLWSKANAVGAIAGVIVGMIAGVTSWLTTTAVEYGRITLSTTGRNAPTLTGNLVAILTGGAVHAIISFISPDNYDWESTRALQMLDKDGQGLDMEEYDDSKLEHSRMWIIKWGCVFTFLIVVLWPIAALPAGVFSEGFFTFWAVISISWGTIGSLVIIILPLYEHWDIIALIIDGMFSNNIILDKVDDIGLKMSAILSTMPEAEKIYLLEKEKTMVMKEDYAEEEVEASQVPLKHIGE